MIASDDVCRLIDGRIRAHGKQRVGTIAHAEGLLKKNEKNEARCVSKYHQTHREVFALVHLLIPQYNQILLNRKLRIAIFHHQAF